jgi:hypothetical protein
VIGRPKGRPLLNESPFGAIKYIELSPETQSIASLQDFFNLFIDKSILLTTFTAQTQAMKLTGVFYYGYYFYFNSKSRD